MGEDNTSLNEKKMGCPRGHPILVCIHYKPSSVLRLAAEPLSFIYYGDHSPSLATYPPTLDEQPLIVGIHGLATHEAHCRGVLLPSRWALTPPSHPYPLRGGYFLLRYYILTNIKPLTCAVLCVARTFLPHPKVAAIERVCGCKDSENSLFANPRPIK